MKEEYRPVKGYEGIYEVSNTGKVKSLERKSIPGVCYHKKEKILKNYTTVYGYHVVALFNRGVRKVVLVHRLVAIAFVPEVDNKPIINHIDGNKTNNHPSNLEWSTYRENNQHAVDTGLVAHPALRKKYKGKEHHNSKLTEKDIRYIQRNCKYNGGSLSNAEMARKLGVARQTVRGIATGNTWKHMIK